MKILICGPEGSGKTTLAMPLSDLINAVYVNKDSYKDELRGYIDGLVAGGKTVVIDKRCASADAVEYLHPDYIIWMDTVPASKDFTKPVNYDYHVSKWFIDTHTQLAEVVKNYMLKLQGKPTERL